MKTAHRRLCSWFGRGRWQTMGAGRRHLIFLARLLRVKPNSSCSHPIVQPEVTPCRPLKTFSQQRRTSLSTQRSIETCLRRHCQISLTQAANIFETSDRAPRTRWNSSLSSTSHCIHFGTAKQRGQRRPGKHRH
ncbi:hypothetical protein DPMN_112677 [Dreissena polymorpha]|uniref:Uncharacterized protein n=1 Tax=Dreissena polymorpha TaxID=45954 RepID=A0A9D4QPZ1_DREPO|nr:hypothetical protein DPMN_112677 [Dreissena polymorpha]